MVFFAGYTDGLLYRIHLNPKKDESTSDEGDEISF